MKSKIIESIISNKIINDYLSKVEAGLRDDFKSHIYLILLEMMEDKIKYKKIKQIYKDGHLGRYVTGIITNQLKSNNSSFTTTYKVRFQEIDDIDVPDDTTETLNRDIIIKKLLIELNNIYFADAVLYKLYRGIDPITNEIKQPMTYTEIEKLIGISYRSIRTSIMKTDKIIKDKIKL